MTDKKCGMPASFRYTWPGRDESFVCLIHATGLQNIAAAMGLHIQLIWLSYDEMAVHTCCQTVRADGEEAN